MNAIERFLVKTGFLATDEESLYLDWADGRLDEIKRESRLDRPISSTLNAYLFGVCSGIVACAVLIVLVRVTA